MLANKLVLFLFIFLALINPVFASDIWYESSYKDYVKIIKIEGAKVYYWHKLLPYKAECEKGKKVGYYLINKISDCNDDTVADLDKFVYGLIRIDRSNIEL
jgi:hypothetical protein